jgi:hypothetical protein
LKPKLINHAISGKEVQFSITKFNWIMLYEDILPVYIENCVKPINKNTALQIIKVGDIYLSIYLYV